jgi:hypothetical protein
MLAWRLRENHVVGGKWEYRIAYIDTPDISLSDLQEILDQVSD